MVELRVQDLVDDIKTHIINDDTTTLFDIDRWREQYTLNQYYYEVFSQMKFLILSNSYPLPKDCAKAEKRLK
jgi:hypothetical protein